MSAAVKSAGLAAARGDLWREALVALKTWRRRSRERRELMRLSDLELRDFGIGRTDAIDEASKPFWRC